MKIEDIFKNLKWVFFDIDGVMTDGNLYYSANGEELKVFNVKDGHGLKMLKNSGIKIAIISGRGNEALKNRLEEMKIDIAVYNRSDKGLAFDELEKKLGSEIRNSICVGDDLPDLELFERCKLGFAVANAVDEVKEKADYILKTDGGKGAVREVCEMILEGRMR